MQPRISLRSRIAGTMLALVAAAGVLFGLWTHVSDDRMENALTRELLVAELDHYEDELAVRPGAVPLSSANLRIYGPSQSHELPTKLSGLGPGEHRPITIGDKLYHVLIRDGSYGRMVITYDVTLHERQEKIAVMIMVLGLGALLIMTAWAAFGVSNRLVGPVHELAHRLAQIEPGKHHRRIAGEFDGTELEPIARSVDTMLERLEGFVAREQSFTETASHELRTPLAVVQGAVELVAEQTRSQPNTQKAVGRIQRAVREMTEFIEALLVLSREDRLPDPGDGSCDVPTLLARVVDDLQSIASDRRISLDVEPGARLRIAAPDSVLTMIVSNLLRNAIQHGKGERIECRLRGRTLAVVSDGEVAPAFRERLFERRFTTRNDGHGIGLYIAHKICLRYGWSIDLASECGRTTASVTF